MADDEGGNYDQTSAQLSSELSHPIEGDNSNNVVSENTTGVDNETSPQNEMQDSKPRSSSDKSNKDSKGNKKSPKPTVQHSYVSLTVQERQARAEKLRQQRVIDLKKKENDRRSAFEERRKKLVAEENAKRDALLKKITTSSPKQNRVSSRGSFGSSSPRLYSASTSNLSHMRKSQPIGRNIDISSPSERSRSTSGTKDDLPKRPSSAIHRPRSSLYLARQHPTTDQKSQPTSDRPTSRSSSLRSTTRPQSAFGSSTVRNAAERPSKVSPSASSNERPRVSTSASTRPALKKNITPSTTTTKKETIKSNAKPLPKPKLTSNTTPQRPSTADKTRSKTPNKPKQTTKAQKETKEDKTTLAEKKKVIRKPPGLSTTQTVATTTTEVLKTEKEPHVDNKKIIKKTKVEITKTVEEKPEIIIQPTENEKARIEEAEQRDREAALERERKEEEEKQQIEAEQRKRDEELEKKAKEELQRRAVEREHNKKLEEEARLERKKRVEMIMAKVSGKKDSPETPPSTTMDNGTPPQEETSEDDDPSSAKQRVDEILKRVSKPKEENQNIDLFDSTENIFEADPPIITISLEEDLAKAVEPVNQESHSIQNEEVPKQISDNWITSDETSNTTVTTTATTKTTTSQSEPILDLSSDLKLNDSITNQSNELQNQTNESKTDNESDFNLNEFDPINSSIQNEVSNDMKLLENGNHFNTDDDEVKANGDTFKAGDQKEDEQNLWDEAEQHMATSKQTDDLQFNKNSEEGKLWQVAEGQLELSECF